MQLHCTVNGQKIDRAVEGQTNLMRFLREELLLTGTKNGCESGHCGTCTVIVNGVAKRACIVKLRMVQDAEILTIEGLGGTIDRPHPIQQAFLDVGAVQCGFCTPGMVLATKALLDVTPRPSEQQIREALQSNLCRCTGYEAIYRAVFRAAAMLNGDPLPEGPAAGLTGAPAPGVVRANVMRKDAPAKVLGHPVFADDLQAPGALHGVLLLSEFTHARLVTVDCTAARAVPGVAAVCTRADLPGRNHFGLYYPEQQVYADTEVFFRGEVIAAVFAETRELALQARDLIKVTYEPLPILDSAEANMAPGAPKVRPDLESNIAHHVGVRKGDADAVFATAPLVVEGEYSTQAVEHAYLEPESCVATPEPDGSITVRGGNQGSHDYRKMIAASLALPEQQVRVILTACGGGFGGKEEPTVHIHAALGALKTGRPVRMVLTREESLRMSVKRHPMRIKMRHAVAADGTLLAVESYVVGDGGAYLSLTKPVIFRSAVTATGPYVVPNVKADSYGVFTHCTPKGAFRGFGSTQICFAAEIQMDKIARALALDPVELRRKNGYRAGSVTGTGQVLGDGTGFIPCLDAAEQALKDFRSELAHRPQAPHLKVGFGVAGAYKNVGIGNGLADTATAEIELTAAGRILVKAGAADIGQGSDTLAAQFAAHTLGVPYDLVDVVACDTAVSPEGGMTTASRQTFVTGNAIKHAALGLRTRMGRFLPALATPAPTGVTVPVSLVTQHELREAYRAMHDAGEQLHVAYTYTPPPTVAHQTQIVPPEQREDPEHGIHYSYCFATAAVAVEVNTQTGAVEVLKIAVAQDVGTAIHPLNVQGQIEGAVAMGIGYALSEQFVEEGDRLITNNLNRLGVPRITDLPRFQTVTIEDPQTTGPYGAKGMGEVGLNPVAPAISNAIFDAVGVRLQDLPMKPERVLAALALN